MTEFEMKLKAAEYAARMGKISRRDFVQLGLAAGLAVPAGLTMFSGAAKAAPKKGGNFIIGMEGGSASDSLDPRTYADSVMIGSSLGRLQLPD